VKWLQKFSEEKIKGNMSKQTSVVVIGGSAGSFTPLLKILKLLPENFRNPVIVILHRLKNVDSDIERLISSALNKTHVKEPEDKDEIKPGYIYLAPRNYHLLVEEDKTFSLDYSELVDYSRPSINVTMQSVSNVYGKQVAGIVLCGANSDGAAGLQAIIKNGGTAIVQQPSTCEYAAMPRAAMEMNKEALVLSPEGIADFLRNHL